MHISKFLLSTFREIPAEAETISQQLMLRSGMIRKLASGIYTWLPLGLRVLQKVEAIVRQEMNKSGALEVLLAIVQPVELWQKSKRLENYGPTLLQMQDRNQHQFCFGPTHEEVITDLMQKELRSYKQLPVILYQIQTKFRDEIRPRFGVMRAREFVMKDAYSFHLDAASLQETYQLMYETYTRIFQRLGLRFRAVAADSGAIGGKVSHEFHVLADAGEDQLAFCEKSDYAANLELATTLEPNYALRPAPTKTMQPVATPGQCSIEDICTFLKVIPQQTLKTLIVVGKTEPLIALVLRGDHELNAIKAEQLKEIAAPLTLANEQDIFQKTGCHLGSLGPVGLNIPILADRDALLLADFVCGANQDGYHLTGVNWERDLPIPKVADLRKANTGDLSPDGKGPLKIVRGIEVGHIFQLGDKYSAAFNATVLTTNGKASLVQMGCYGLGVSRIIAAAIEQSHDEHGIIWNDAIAPFQVAILPMTMHKSYRVKAAAEKIYQELLALGIDVLFDDRKERAGVMFADLELIGIPHLLVISESCLDQGFLEYKNRRSGNKEQLPITTAAAHLKNHLLKL